MRRLLALAPLLAPACAAAGTEPDWSALRAELAQRAAVDQELREKIMAGPVQDPALLDRLVDTDRDNTAWMKELVTRHGWPTIARVGEQGAVEAWLLVQHADHDVDFQERCLPLLRAAVEEGQATRKTLAYLEDRVAMHRGRPQRYGTQFVSSGGRMEPYTLEDPARVDEWRAEVGLGTLAEYAKNFERE